jgi:hypothetical protein
MLILCMVVRLVGCIATCAFDRPMARRLALNVAEQDSAVSQWAPETGSGRPTRANSANIGHVGSTDSAGPWAKAH